MKLDTPIKTERSGLINIYLYGIFFPKKIDHNTKIKFPFDGNVGNGPPFFQKIEVLNTDLVFFLSFLSDCPKNDGNKYSSPKFIKINQVSEKTTPLSKRKFLIAQTWLCTHLGH